MADDDFRAYQAPDLYSQIGDRFEQFEQLRANGAATRLDGQTVMATSRAAAERVFRHPEIYSSRFGPIGGAHRPLIPIEIDPPDHHMYRKLLDPMFAPRAVNSLEPAITALVNEHIDAFIDDGRCVFDEQLAVPLPTKVFLSLMGLPLDDSEKLLAFKDGILRPGYREGIDLTDADAVHELNQRVVGETYEYFQAFVDERRSAPPVDDIMGRVLDGELDGRRLTDEEVLDACFLLLIAGLDTITNSLTLFYYQLAHRPDLRRQLVADPAAISNAVEELLRWETPTPAVFRIVTETDDLLGVEVKPGDRIVIDLGVANTDPAFQADAGELHFDRDPNPHFSFSGGIHRCSGSHLARQELRITMREWHRRIPDYRLAPDSEPIWPPGLRSVENLVLEWEVQ